MALGSTSNINFPNAQNGVATTDSFKLDLLIVVL